MSAIIKTIVGILITVMIFAFLFFVYDVSIQKLAIVGFVMMLFFILLLCFWYAYQTSEEREGKRNVKAPGLIQRMEELWQEIMGENNALDIYTGSITTIVWEDNKRYTAGLFDAVSGRHKGSLVVLIYCTEDDDLVLIAPTPKHVLIDNPFHGFEPKRISKLTRELAREGSRQRDKSSLVEVNMGGKEDPVKKENDEFEKNIGK